MHVAVGSQNPVKVAAVEGALDRFEPTVAPVAVESGVAEQPHSTRETIEGAETRARRARRRAGVEYGVGLESGVARIDAASGRFLIAWAAATDGDRLEHGAGPSLRLPNDVADRVDGGEELGPVMDDVLETENVGREGGAVGALTDGLTDRTAALASAVACAFGPFATDRDQ